VNRKEIITMIVLFVAAIVLSMPASASAQNCCSPGMPERNDQTEIAQGAEQSNEQTAIVELNDKGFEPSSLKLKAGIRAKVAFVRKTDEGCAKEVVIKEYGINRELPLNEPITVEFIPRKGEFSFACGMNMLKGKLIVE